ncbi:MAG: hypothetical protein ABIK96_10760 [bacterium]
MSKYRLSRYDWAFGPWMNRIAGHVDACGTTYARGAEPVQGVLASIVFEVARGDKSGSVRVIETRFASANGKAMLECILENLDPLALPPDFPDETLRVTLELGEPSGVRRSE